MDTLGSVLQELVDALETADTEAAFMRAADRTASRLGFRWFAYLGFADPKLTVLSSYPRLWARHYLEHGYERVDPVIRRARAEPRAFCWSGQACRNHTQQQRQLIGEAAEFGICSGVTVPIRAGFDKFATFTFATDERRSGALGALQATEASQLIGLYYHAHVYAKLQVGLLRNRVPLLTGRERQCLTWAAKGKTMADTALILGISKRTVLFHLENARAKLQSPNLTQAVAKAVRRGFLAV